jgi:hypothetical protein
MVFSEANDKRGGTLPNVYDTRGLISLWLYEENKLWDRKNIFTLHIPP